MFGMSTSDSALNLQPGSEGISQDNSVSNYYPDLSQVMQVWLSYPNLSRDMQVYTLIPTYPGL